LLSRILDIRVLIIALAVIGHGALSYVAWSGDDFALGMLIAFGLFWIIMAFMNSLSWSRSLNHWTQTLDLWKETIALADDYSSLLSEATEVLSTYDREQADDIIGRANTIALMRMQNQRERMHD
jgi:ABC-type multidrug transport system fused ATPase/permease subunit